MNIAILEQLPANCLASATLEKDIVWDYNCGSAIDLQQGSDVLQEVKLLV
jgi:hypothetical protein